MCVCFITATGSSVVCELVVQAHSMGPFNTKLLCHLELCDATFTLPVEGCIEVMYYIWNVCVCV